MFIHDLVHPLEDDLPESEAEERQQIGWVPHCDTDGIWNT